MNLITTGDTSTQLLPRNYQFNLSDFALFLSVMKNKTAYECTLSIILDEPELKLAEVEVEQVVLNKSGKRAIRLDAWHGIRLTAVLIRKCRMKPKRMMSGEEQDFIRVCWILRF